MKLSVPARHLSLLVLVPAMGMLAIAADPAPVASNTLRASSQDDVEILGQLGGTSNAIAQSGSYAYVGIGPRMVVVDVSNPRSPRQVGQTLVLESVVVDITVGTGYAYVHILGRDSMYVFDIRDPAKPSLLSTVPNAGTMSIEWGGTYLVNDLLYSAGHDALHIIAVDDPRNPRILSSLDLGELLGGVVVAGTIAYAPSSAGLHIVDVTDATRTRVLNTVALENPGQGIAVRGRYAFVSTGMDMSVVDVGDPLRAAPVARLVGCGGYSISVSGTRVYGSVGSTLCMADIADPSNPEVLGHAIVPAWIEAIVPAGGIAFLADGYAGLRVVDVSDPITAGEVGFFEPPGLVAGVSAVQTAAGYVADQFVGLRIVDISDDGELTAAETLTLSEGSDGLNVDDQILGVSCYRDLCFLRNSLDKIDIVDVSRAGSARWVGEIELPALAYDIAVSADHLFAVTGQSTLLIYDVSLPHAPREIGPVAALSAGTALHIAADVLYVADEGLGLVLFDVRDPARATRLGAAAISGAVGVTVEGGIAYVLTEQGLSVIDVSSPSAPEVKGDLSLGHYGSRARLFARNGYVYVSRGSFQIIDAVDPTAPRYLTDVRLGIGDHPIADVAGGDDGRILVAAGDGGVFMVRHTPDRPAPTPDPRPSPELPDSCRDVIDLQSGARHQGAMGAPSEGYRYRFTIPEAFSEIIVTLTDLSMQADLTVRRDCIGPAGPGTGRHIGPGTGRHIGDGRRQLRFNALAQTGDYYVDISPRVDAATFPVAYELHIEIVPADPDSLHTLILTDLGRVAAATGAGPVEMDAWSASLEALADHASVRGLLVRNIASAGPEGLNTDVQLAYEEWDDRSSEVARANRVAEALRDWIWNTQVLLPKLRYVVIAADDRVVPHYRLRLSPTGSSEPGWVNESEYRAALGGGGLDWSSPIGNALVSNRTLTDDYYAAPDGELLGTDDAAIATGGFVIPRLAIGRLVETPVSMTRLIEAFLSGDGSTVIDHAVLGGHDFMTDGLRDGAAILQRHGLDESRRDEHLGDRMNVSAFRRDLLDMGFDLAYLGFHSTHDQHLTPDGEAVTALDIASSDGELPGGLVYTLACHGGLSVPGDTHPSHLDFPEVWLSRGASLVGSTGWAYGGQHDVYYQEALFSYFTDLLATGEGSSLGDALVAAKRIYYEDLRFGETPLSALHAKTLAGTILYGLPMSRMRVADQVLAAASQERPDPVRRQEAQPPAILGQAAVIRRSARFSFDSGEFNEVTTESGMYYQFGADPVWSEAGRPMQPKHLESLREIALGGGRNYPPRAVVVTSASYRDLPGVDPVVSSAGVLGSDALSQAEPVFSAPGWYPPVPVAVQRVAELPSLAALQFAEASSRLQFYLGQYHSAEQVLRLYDELELSITYSDSDDDVPPAVSGVWGTASGDSVRMSVEAQHDPSGIVAVVATCSTPDGRIWTGFDLRPEGKTRRWSADVPSTSECFIQIVDGAGNVGVEHDGGLYYAVDLLPQPPAQLATQRIFLPLLLREQCRPLTVRADVALVIDVSTSMLESTPAGSMKVDRAIDAAVRFAHEIASRSGVQAGSEGNRVAVIGFNETAFVELPLSPEGDRAERALRALREKVGVGSRLDRAIVVGSSVLGSGGGGAERTRVLVLLTDGVPSGAGAATVEGEAAEAKAAGVRIYAVGVGTGPDMALLERIASSASMAYSDPSAVALAEIYDDIARSIGCSPADFWAGR